MNLDKILDFAIMANETAKNPKLKAGYTIDDKTTYDCYLENGVWKKLIDQMQIDNPTAYEKFSKGGGKELEERKTSRGTYPPKMASFGSSSRMIYNLMGKDKTFLFEKKLGTTVGGTANLDGFKETALKYVFVEAKCKEPYSAKSNKISKAYKELYEFISLCPRNNLIGDIGTIDDKNIKVDFKVDNKSIEHFDIKQMICHLLGIATAFLKGELGDKKIDFVYLLYNPKLIEIKEEKEKIYHIYEQTCMECDAIDFKALFESIVYYLQSKKELGSDKNLAQIVDNFSFRMCDQSNMTI